jgi:hypothetical protein
MKRLLIVALALLFSAAAHAQLFSDNFTRGSDPGPLTPWIVQSGVWTITGGIMQAGTNATFSYANANITNNWTNYTVQARFRFQANAFGGGLGARLDTNSGARYSAWIYPENSPGGSNVLRLIKFQTLTSFGYLGSPFAYMAQTNLASVGTNFHTVRIDLQGNQINVYLDGVQRINTTDAEGTYYTNGAVSLDMWTDSSGALMGVDDVLVNGSQLTANADAYSAVSGLQLSVPAPGVLGNDSGGSGPLNASLVSGASHGTLALSSNGGFNYTANGSFVGADTFTYRANDGATNSSATVTITVGPNRPPLANGDGYSVLVSSSLSVASPGVLANDTDPDGNNLTAVLASSPVSGSLTLTNNGGFTYTPNVGFIGSDSFTYRANDGLTTSPPATVTISVLPPALFSDDFTRGADPGPISPWIAEAGAWTVGSGAMRGGTNNLFNYGFAYITNSWTDYSVQARLQFPAGAFGGGLGARLNPLTGAHYAAWVYPENSPGGGPALRLIKFQNFGSFSQIQQASLASVGTNYHTVKLGFAGNQIAVYFDGALTITATDSDYSNGGVSLDFWTDAIGYVFSADDVIVNKLATDNSYTVYANHTNTIAAPGVLGDDTGIYGTTLSATIVDNPTNGSVVLSANGGLVYTPLPDYVGPDTFTYSASDGTANLGTAAVNLTVVYLNTAPILPAQTNRTIAEAATLIVTNTATDNDVPTNALTYSLLSPPSGATINSNGVITWTPTEAQGPSTTTITTRVVDNGSPPLSATNSFVVVVTEVNSAPTLPNIADRTVNELVGMSVSDTATDTDLPANALTYSFLSSPTGATISGSGIINWTPSEAQGPSTNLFTIRVVDNGAPPLSATNSFTVVVNEVNSAPVLPAQTNRSIPAQTTLTVTNTATDTDIPANTLTYTFLSAPANAAISPNGIITWTPSADQDHSTNLFRTWVQDNGTPLLNATNSFTVFVNSNPIVVLDSSLLVLEGCAPTNNAIDAGETVTMNFGFRNIGTGPATNLNVTLLETNGIVLAGGPKNFGLLTAGDGALVRSFTFGNTGSCGGTLTANLQIKDGPNLLGITNIVLNLGQIGITFTQNFDAVTIPNLPSGWSSSSSGAATNWVTVTGTNNTAPNSAFSPNAVNIGLNDLTSLPILLPSTPAQLSFRNEFDLEPHTTTEGYDGGVLEMQIGTNGFVDIVAAGGTFVSGAYTHTISPNFSNPLAGRQAWSGTSAGYIATVVNLPAAAQGQTVQFRWLCGTDTSNGRTGWRIDSIGITARTCCQNTAPVLGSIADQTINELSTLTVTNTATDSSTTPGGLIYTLVNPPTGAKIDSNGVITWSPSEAQGPGADVITTVVTDNAVPPLSATNNFTVTVLEVNSVPVLPVQPDLTTVEGASLIVTNTASDGDFPANDLFYSLYQAPAGASIDGNGIIAWTATGAPGTNLFTTIVVDDGNPSLSSTNSFLVYVRRPNTAPVLPGQQDRTIDELTTLQIVNTASDSDLPPNSLTYVLLHPPAGAGIDSSGLITWTPSEAQGPGTNLIVTVVTDDGFPPLSATNSFTVVVMEVNSAPVLPLQTNRTITELTTLTVTNTASDSDLPTNILTYSLSNPPTGVTIDTNGVITWTPSEAQGPGTNVITTIVTDNGVPPLSATNSFTVVVTEVNIAPVLPAQSDVTIDALSALTVTNAATDADLPPNILTYVLLNPPAGAAIDSNGIITWTPSNNQAPSTNTIETTVTDDGVPSLTATNIFIVVVRPSQVVSPPVIQSITVSGDEAVLTWGSVSGHAYRVQFVNSLEAASWTDISPDIVASSSTVSTTNTLSGSAQRFYRIRALP